MTESYGFLSTYPPTQCGLATFTASLAKQLALTTEVGIVRIVDRIEPDVRPEVIHQMVNGSTASEAAARALSRFDVAVVQHEYGIYGGDDGEAVIDILRGSDVPTIVVLHTVLAEPSAHQRAVLEAVAREAATVVVMTRTAQRRLRAHYSVDSTNVVVIPHGAPNDWTAVRPTGGSGERPMILTWGLLGPGKGIEWAIEALADLADLDPQPRYLIAGETHPRVLDHEGDVYRDRIKAQAAGLGIGHLVEFDDRYLDQVSLRGLVAAADAVLLPYDSTDQVTSGVLIEAVASRRPVVATAFPHAVELLCTGAGIVVPHKNPPSIAAALRRILTDVGLSASMVDAAEKLAPDLTWRAVADRYRSLGRELVAGAVPVVA